MPYDKKIGSQVEGTDYASQGLSVLMSRIKDQLNEDIEEVMEENFPEQSILSLLVVLRLIGERFPIEISNNFSPNDLDKTKTAFEEWYEMAEKKIPKKHREGLLKTAEEEFKLFEETIFS